MPERARVTVVGAGLAGSEASLKLAGAGLGVDLFEMRPGGRTEAHRTGWFAELVCSNSLGSEEVVSGKGLLKEELRILGSALLPIADAARVPAGKALAVDRERFARAGDGGRAVRPRHPGLRGGGDRDPGRAARRAGVRPARQRGHRLGDPRR